MREPGEIMTFDGLQQLAIPVLSYQAPNSSLHDCRTWDSGVGFRFIRQEVEQITVHVSQEKG